MSLLELIDSNKYNVVQNELIELNNLDGIDSLKESITDVILTYDPNNNNNNLVLVIFGSNKFDHARSLVKRIFTKLFNIEEIETRRDLFSEYCEAEADNHLSQICLSNNNLGEVNLTGNPYSGEINLTGDPYSGN
jgi:hypothetical protein